MADDGHSTIQQLLRDLELGSRAALDELFLHTYQELREAAHRQRQRWHGDQTLDTTALINEAYVKLAGRHRIHAESRTHFLALAAQAMRHVLVNYARDRRALKRGGAFEKVPFDETDPDTGQESFSLAQADDLLALHEALDSLDRIDHRQARVVECRVFGGMTVDETAVALGTSPRTVKRDWAVAQAWLQRRMEQQP